MRAVPTYIAFLRAINLGSTRKFPKAAIVRACENAGFTDAETYINSGNVRVTTPMRSVAKVEATLEKSFAEEAGFEVPTVALTQQELREIAAHADELARGHEGRYYVSLLKKAPTADEVKKLDGAGREEERAVVRGRGAHLLLGDEYHTATLTNALVEKHLGVATNRNLNVIRTLAEKWA
ncbi:MAG TPA: DUF1697 domain-containing protein [Nocardioides sp.]|jgi:uncharacterized protein (DUF1697 family)|nr:DUF1697 domain-containing protein [Nocardioides sp.]